MKNFSKFSLFLLLALTVVTATNSAAQKNPLAKNLWIIESYGATDNQRAAKIISKVDNQFPLIQFNAKGFSGYIAGCNSISFAYTVQKRKLRFKIKLSTTKACADDLMKQDHEIISALEKSESFKINGNNLKIYYANGKIMRLKRLAR